MKEQGASEREEAGRWLSPGPEGPTPLELLDPGSAGGGRPATPLAMALRGALLSAREPRAGRALLDRALRRRPRAGWALALRARAEEDPRRALAWLDRAARREPSGWILRDRALALERAGRMREAVACLAESARRDGGGPAFHAQLGRCLLHMKRYRQAAAQFARALRRWPGRFDLRQARAGALWHAGQAARGRRELMAAARTPGQRLEAARFALLTGDGAERGIGRSPRLRGLRALRAGRLAAAARSLEDPQLRLAARGLSRMPRANGTARPGARGRLNLVGLGLDYPRQATLETLAVIAESDLVVNNLAGARAAEFLAAFSQRTLTISFEGEGSRYWAGKILATVRPGRATCFVTRGHPLVSGHLALLLLRAARRRGIETRCYGALSTVDQALALGEEVLGETFWGLQVYDSRLIAARSVRLETGVPALLYLGLRLGKDARRQTARYLARLCAALRAEYPRGHAALLYGPRYDERRLDRVALARLERRLGGVDPRELSSLILLIPAARELMAMRESERYARRHRAFRLGARA